MSTHLLPSFNPCPARDEILEFVSNVADPASDRYVPPDERIVVFDNDGTLWVEQPLPSQIYFALDRIRDLAAAGAEWTREMPFKAVVERDRETMAGFGIADVVTIVGKAHSLTDVASFDGLVQSWLAHAEHPVLQRRFTDLVYQPMMELLELLRANEFKIFVVSGGSVEFMRAWAPAVYGIPAENIIGTTFVVQVIEDGEGVHLSQTDQLEAFDDYETKIISIYQHLGRKPIMVVGNSDGDLAMMRYSTTDARHPTLMVFVDHTDGDREFDYSQGVIAGALNEGRSSARARGWTVIDMKTDWNTVFSWQ